MNSYAAMMINALIIGFLINSLIKGTLAGYISFAKPAPASAGAQAAQSLGLTITPADQTAATAVQLTPVVSAAEKIATSIVSNANTL